MRIETPSERAERLAGIREAARKIHEEAEARRAAMSPEDLARATGVRHQSSRERQRRLRQRGQ